MYSTLTMIILVILAFRPLLYHSHSEKGFIRNIGTVRTTHTHTTHP